MLVLKSILATAVCGLCLFGACPLLAEETDEWFEYKDSVLVEGKYFDGDSFYIYAEGNKRRPYIIRLLFVDAAETDARFPDRLDEQGKYFGIEERETVMKMGEEAAELTQKLLKKPFTVYTQKHKAMGKSKKPRYYGMIKTSEGEWLSQTLVEKGLARIYGWHPTELPNGVSDTRFRLRLKGLENLAKKQGDGAWESGEAKKKVAKNNPAARLIPKIEEQTITLKKAVFIYSLDTPGKTLGRLGSGREIKVLKATSPFMVQVEFTTSKGKTISGLCNRLELGVNPK
jgi:endonuclease YncB( thermonuclease family)